MGSFLILIALSVGFSFAIFGLPWGFLRNLPRGYKETSRRRTNIAVALDIFIKHLYSSMLDDLFVGKKTESFSHRASTTISEDLGLFSVSKSLNNRGEWLVQRLHYLDPWHVEKAMGQSVPKVTLTFWQQAARFAVMLTLFAVMMCLLAVLCVGIYILTHLIILSIIL